MINSDTRTLLHLRDIPAAFGLLTRLPVRVNTELATKRGAAAAWAYPIVGGVVGALAALTGVTALAIGLPPAAASLLVIASQVILTGAMHEDGLADCADGFWGGWERSRRLAIMKDSHIGTYGVAALTLSLMLRWVAISALTATAGFATVLIAAGLISRASMVVMMALMPHARDTGLSHAVGRPSRKTALIALVIAVTACLFAVGATTVTIVVVATLAGLGWAVIAKTKINGQTGDVLGALQQITEIAILLCALAASAA